MEKAALPIKCAVALSRCSLMGIAGWLAGVLFWAAAPVWAAAQKEASPTDNPASGVEKAAVQEGEEEVIDLDSLEEEEGAEAAEPLLPVVGTIPEVERQPLLVVVALVLLAPLALMLFAPKRKKKRQDERH